MMTKQLGMTAYKAAYENECRKFQQETRRTSELTQMLLSFIEHLQHSHPAPTPPDCAGCALIREARGLIDRPINV